jgi:arginyl-tRNA synthetase
MNFDLGLAKRQSNENPVYYVQYAHARIASILRYAQEVGAMGDRVPDDADVSLLHHPAEMALVRKLLELQEVIEQAVTKLAPHHLTHYAQDLAAAFHTFYRDCRVVSSEPEDRPIMLARLKLMAATKIVLARTLGLMGMTAPERM